MADQRRAGLIQLQVDGEVYDAKGEFSYNLGAPKREAIIGADGVHGYKETPQVPFIEGAITDRGTLDMAKVVSFSGGTVNLSLSNGKSIVLGDAWYAGDGTGTTGESEFGVRWEGSVAKEA
jgi:hypothetical protein